MDYGHTNPSDNLLEFPTPDNVETNDNLDLTNPETSWDQPVSIEHDKKALGSEALASSLEMPPMPEQELGKPIPYTTNLEPITPPAEDTTTDADIAKEALEVKPESIKATETLNEAGIRAIEHEKQEYLHGDINEETFYQHVRGEMMPELIENYETPNWTAVQSKTADRKKRAA